MGGHGGLNILPQKRWNVYNRDNRLKVARDEAKAREEEAKEKEKHLQAEREYRHQLLLKRAGHSTEQQKAESTTEGLLDSIFSWKEEELVAEHPEVEREKQDELRRRGNQETWTSDAKFDERFQLGFGLTKTQPWYASAPKREEDEPSTSTAQPASGLPRLQPEEPSAGSPRHTSDSDSDGSQQRSKKHKHKKSHKGSKHRHKDRHKETHKAKSKAGVLSVTGGKVHKGGKSIEQLRQERLQREHAERVRARSVVASTVDISERMQAPGVYSSGFGYAAAVKKRRAAPG